MNVCRKVEQVNDPLFRIQFTYPVDLK